LVAIGLISFAAVAQFAPAIFGGMYWKSGTRDGALAGLLAGFSVWAYTLLLPSFAKFGWLPEDFVVDGLFGIALLRPQQLFGLSGLDQISHSLFWNVLANIGCYIGFSLAGKPGSTETSQATLFVDVFRRSAGIPDGSRVWRGSTRVSELLPLIGRFLGPEKAREAFLSYALRRGLASIDELEVDAELVHFAETLLSGAIGAASARVMVSSVAQEEPLGLDEVMYILDEASQVRAYSLQLEDKSRELEAATTELRAANERLKELDRMKDDFISTVTHELRTPLTSIRAFSEILMDDPKIDLAERNRFLAIITKETERLTRLINQVLDMAKIDSDNAEWHTAELDMREVIQEALEATDQLYVEQKVRLDVDLPQSVPTVMADRGRVIQVMLNLLSNAVKFCDRNAGHVTVRLRCQHGALRVDVGDNGPGIANGDKQLIFEKFRQVGDTLSAKPRGTGLGLPIRRQIIERFGGKLWVESVEGQGSVFSFTLPLNAATTAQTGKTE
jgi:signal transduction histidine kinase